MGFFKQTILDVVIRKLNANQENGNTEIAARYKDLRKILRDADAKCLDELTEEEKEEFGVE